jgi:glycerate 2-kinase
VRCVIRNIDSLLRNAATPRDRLARQLALRALDETVLSANPNRVMTENVKLKGFQLLVKNDRYDLTKIERIFVVGGGKACARMAYGLEKILGDRITEGYVNIPQGTGGTYPTQRIELNESSHPLPDQAGVKGAQRMKELVRDAGKHDLIVCMISGGGSSLMPLPRRGVRLREKHTVTKALLKAGANINELNAVRKHLSDIKGGWLAKSVDSAQIITLILSDVVGDPLGVIASGPTAPDHTTFSDAILVLKKYKLWERAPQGVRKVLMKGKAGRIPETPKPDDEVFGRVRHFVLFNNRQACEAAVSYLKRRGVPTAILSSAMEGEANQVGRSLGSILREMTIWDSPVAKPSAFVVGGETTVTVRGKGVGGRNQEVALGAALRIPTVEGVVVASIGTDGVDGPTDAAGAIVDGRTLSRANAHEMEAEKFLADNNSYRFFSKLGDLVLTGPTGTNVNDVAVIVALNA